jgi:hypothetical protein
MARRSNPWSEPKTFERGVTQRKYEIRQVEMKAEPDNRPRSRVIIHRLLAAAILGLCSHAARAAPTSFTLQSIVVEQDGQWHQMGTQEQTPAQCARFRLTAPAARRWFRQAREVSEHAWLEELDWTPCFAAGTLVTSDGRPLRWQLDRAGRAQVTISPSVSVYLGGPELPFQR